MDLVAVKDYFKKLQRVIAMEAEFKFLDMALVKKNKIDDLLCCILASLPDIFKKNLKGEESKELKSIIAYNNLFAAIKGKFILNSSVYRVETVKANSIISVILSQIERDIASLEKKYQ